MPVNPDNKVTFGKNKGYTWAEVYRFSPDYIEWAIEYYPAFCINIELFQNLSKPTPFKKKFPGQIGGQITENVVIRSNESDIPHAYIFLKTDTIPAVNYKFPDYILWINEEKAKGGYTVAPYLSSTNHAASFDEMIYRMRHEDELICFYCKGSRKTGCFKGFRDCNKFDQIIEKNLKFSSSEFSVEESTSQPIINGNRLICLRCTVKTGCLEGIKDCPNKFK